MWDVASSSIAHQTESLYVLCISEESSFLYSLHVIWTTVTRVLVLKHRKNFTSYSSFDLQVRYSNAIESLKWYSWKSNWNEKL